MDPNDATEIAYNNGYNRAVNDLRGEGQWTQVEDFRHVTRGIYRRSYKFIHQGCKNPLKSTMKHPADFCPACGKRMTDIIVYQKENYDDKAKTSRRT